MHIYLITRGIKEASEKFIKELSSKYLPLPFRNKKNGKITNVLTPVHVRPIQLWEIVVPKEQMDITLTTLFPEGARKLPGMKQVLYFLKKLFKTRETFRLLPKEWDKSKKMIVDGDAVERMAIGIKDDDDLDFIRSKEDYIKLGLDPEGDWESEGL